MPDNRNASLEPGRKVLITGATGYVGSVLTLEVARRYPVVAYCDMRFGNPIVSARNVRFIRGDVRDLGHLARALEGVTDVIGLAAIVTDTLVDLNPALAVEVNNQALEGLCNLAACRGVQRFLYASSSSIYGSQPVPATELTEPSPMTQYAWTKLAGEAIVNRFADQMTVCSVRSATACGPAPRMRLDTIVNIFSKQAYFDQDITVHGGDQWRSNIHIGDVADLYTLLLDAPADRINGQAFNATAGNHTALQLAELVQGIMGGFITVNHDLKDDRHYRMNGDKARRILGWQPGHSIEEAIRDNRLWFQLGKVPNPNDDVYYNDRRLGPVVREAAPWPS